MKIAFLVSNMGCGGVERTVTYLSEFMAVEGNEVTIVCISDEQFYSISNKVNLVKLNIVSATNNPFRRVFRIVKRILSVSRAIHLCKPDCVICLDPALVRFISVQHRMSKFKIITSERTNPKMESENKWKAKIKAFKQSDGIIFQTCRARECYPQSITKKGKVIPNAVGNDLVYNIEPPANRRKAITAVGRLAKQKDYSTLLQAFAIFLKKNPDYTLEIYGDGEERESLENQVEKLNLKEKVFFMGAVKNAIMYVATSSCYVLSSIYEGMPNSLMEAMGAGVPCVSTDCPFGPAELIDDHKNGILVPVGNEEAMAEAMSEIVNNSEMSDYLSENARKILESNSIESVANAYLQYIYTLVLD